MTQENLADILVDVALGIVVLRKRGQWSWHARPGATKEDVIKELQFQVNRTRMKHDLLEEALSELKSNSFSKTTLKSES